jgi:hypothetical protein
LIVNAQCVWAVYIGKAFTSFLTKDVKMSKYTIKVRGGRALVVQPSRMSPGVVSIVVLGADRQEVASVSLDVSTVGALLAALEDVACLVEKSSAIAALGARLSLPLMVESGAA